jgi:pimeloyl-ACP methyl ester carboxylesterase
MLGERFSVALPDGRTLDVRVSGPQDGIPLLAHHGTPSGGMPYRPFVEAAAARGLRMVTYSRPGYARSTRHEGRSVGDCAADAAHIMDHLAVDRFYTTGQSGGGPHSLACAALLPDRVIACASTAGVGPYGADGLDFLAGMAQENVDEFGAALEGPEALEAFLEKDAAQLVDVTPEGIVANLGGLVSEMDAAVLTGEFAEHVVQTFREALEPGIWGWYDDDVAFTRPWGFDLASIQVPVAIWQGVQDHMVPPAHGEWLALHVPNARVHVRPDHGHLSLTIGDIDEILDDLIEGAP